MTNEASRHEHTQPTTGSAVSPRLRVWLLVFPGVVLAVLFFFVWRGEEQLTLPQELAGMRLAETLVREEAKKVIDHVHGKGVSPTENAIGYYRGRRGSATLYLSAYRDTAQTRENEMRMRKLISGGNPIFGDYQVAFCYGLGQAHSTGWRLISPLQPKV